MSDTLAVIYFVKQLTYNSVFKHNVRLYFLTYMVKVLSIYSVGCLLSKRPCYTNLIRFLRSEQKLIERKKFSKFEG